MDAAKSIAEATKHRRFHLGMMVLVMLLPACASNKKDEEALGTNKKDGEPPLTDQLMVERALKKDEEPVRADSQNAWNYPIHLGDTRTEVHAILGNPSRTTEVLEEYPASGVTVWFDFNGRLRNLNFAGEAGELYTGASMEVPNWIPSDRPLLFGLTAHSDEAAFRRRLGSPARMDEAGRRDAREVRIVWRKDGYVIDAQFLGTERTGGGKTYPKGCLLWVEVYLGI